jgi:hypothetical protein
LAGEKSNEGSAMWSQLRDWFKLAITLVRRVATLEARVTALEKRLEKQPGDACPFCGEIAMRRIPHQNDNVLFGRGGSAPHYEEAWRCEKCSQTAIRSIRL